MIQAMSGLMSVTGFPDNEPGGMPVKAGVALVDILTGLNATIAILARRHRKTSGKGQHIDPHYLMWQWPAWPIRH